MTKQEINAYAMRVAQSSRTELIVIMYEITQHYLMDAIECAKSGKIDEYRYNLKKAKNFINELSSALDLSRSISADIFSLYRYMNRAMVKADSSVNTDELERIAGMLNKLESAWRKVSESDKSGPMMENAQHIYAGMTYSKGSLNLSYGQNADINRGYKA